MIDKWVRCKRAFYNYYIRGLRKETDNPFLIFGKAWDSIMNIWYDRVKPCQDVEVLQMKFREIFKPEHDFEAKYQMRTQMQGDQIIKGYAEAYNFNTEPFKVLQTQKEIVIKIEGLCKPLHVIIDAVVEYRDRGFMPMDNKTSGTDRKGQYNIDYQNICYIKAVEATYKRKVEGMFYNEVFARKKIDRKCFHRLLLEKTKGQIDYAWQNFCNLANDMVDFVEKNWEDVEKFPMVYNKLICTIGNCAYQEVCEFQDNVRLFVKA